MLKELKKFCTDTLFPIKCLNCKKQGHWLCIDDIDDFSYNNKILVQALHLYKYKFIKDLAEPLGKLLCLKIENLKIENFDYIVPVPLHKRRLRWRGFNQVELLAKEIDDSKVVNALKKIKHTKPQMQLKEHERIFNVRDVFVCIQDVRGKKILLLDDVKTTGSTLKECKLTLLRAGAKRVYPLTLLET